MANAPTLRRAPRFPIFRFEYSAIRKISTPEDIENHREVYAGHAPAQSFLELKDDENVREYLVDAEGKKRKCPTQVHRAIRETLRNNPHNFSVLNSGIVIVARKIEVDDKGRIATLVGASIVNGSQTQGELANYLEEKKQSGEPPFPLHVSFELIVTEDDDLIAEISIARNFQNNVMTISIAGRLGQLDDLENAFNARFPEQRLKKSETMLGDDYVGTEKLLQVVTALTPSDLWLKPGEAEIPNKVYTYSMKAKCLKDFQDVYKKKDDQNEPHMKKYKELYQFYLDIVGDAWELYNKWKRHPGFYGTRLRSIERKDGEITDIPDGIIFPILAALSAFAVKGTKGWRIKPPKSFDDKELIKAAAEVYKEIANSNPWSMGKNKACYSSLYQITSIYRRLSD